MDEFPARVGNENSIVLSHGKIEITADQVGIWRGGRLLARAPCATVRVRRRWLSLGSALRMRVGEATFAVDLSESDWNLWRLSLELLQPLGLVRDVRAGRRAARRLLAELHAHGADVRSQ